MAIVYLKSIMRGTLKGKKTTLHSDGHKSVSRFVVQKSNEST